MSFLNLIFSPLAFFLPGLIFLLLAVSRSSDLILFELFELILKHLVDLVAICSLTPSLISF